MFIFCLIIPKTTLLSTKRPSNEVEALDTLSVKVNGLITDVIPYEEKAHIDSPFYDINLAQIQAISEEEMEQIEAEDDKQVDEIIT